MQKKNNRATLRSRVFQASTWTVGGHFTGQVLRLASNLIMTRLLVPEMFGVMAVVTVIMNGLSSLSQTGIDQCIVNSERGAERTFLNTAWVVQAGRGMLIGLAVVLVALALYFAGASHWLPAGSVYADPLLPAVLAVSSLSVVIAGFRSTYATALYRQVHVGKNTLTELAGTVVGLLAMIVWAVYDRSIWALAVGGIAAEIVRTWLSHAWVAEGKNRFEWDAAAFAEILHFGKWIFVATIFFYLSSQSDRLLLGGLISAGELGVYAIAFFLAAALQQIVGAISTKVIFPALREVHNADTARLGAVYYRVRQYIDLAAYATAGLLFSSGDLLVRLLYDDRYTEAGWMLKILSLSLLGVGFRTVDQCLLALGHVRWISILTATQGVALVIMIPLAFHLAGLEGAIWAIALSFIPNVLLSWWFMQRLGMLHMVLELWLLAIFPLAYLLGIGLRQLLGL
ncbi:MAG: oligosaccharide flippase family protein [Pseudomonadota bacterium]|nr:oligosaccharide flippase family protein [Pseudomonadota bacterium]